MNNFRVEYILKKDADHLANILKAYHKISQNSKRKIFPGINLEWNYTQNHADRTCHLSMKKLHF